MSSAESVKQTEGTHLLNVCWETALNYEFAGGLLGAACAFHRLNHV